MIIILSKFNYQEWIVILKRLMYFLVDIMIVENQKKDNAIS